MNVFQLIAISLYFAIIIAFFYSLTNKFERGWLRNQLRTNKYSARGSFLYVRLLAAVIMLALYLLKNQVTT